MVPFRIQFMDHVRKGTIPSIPGYGELVGFFHAAPVKLMLLQFFKIIMNHFSRLKISILDAFFLKSGRFFHKSRHMRAQTRLQLFK